MDLRLLKEFLTLAETKNYWDAADTLFMNESTLSKHIKKLETELKVPLFLRNTRNVSLTQYGKCLVPYAQKMLENEAAFLEQLDKLILEEKGSLSLGVIPSMVSYHITDILVDFKKKYPEKTVDLLEGDTMELSEALLHHKCSLAFLRESDFHPVDDDIFEKIPFTKDQMCVILPANHKLAAKTSLTLKELSGESFVTLNRNTLLYEFFVSLCAQAGFTPNIAIECKRMDSIFDLIAQNMGIAILTEKHFNTSLENTSANRSALKLIPLTPAIYSQTYLCYLKNSPLSTTAREMIAYIKECV